MRTLIAGALLASAVAGCSNTPRPLPSSFRPAHDTALAALRDSTRTCGTAVYPPSMSVAGIEGQVLISVFVDTTGRAHRDSVTILSASDSAFVAPAVDFVVSCQYTVPRFGGRAMAQRLTAPVEFRLQGGGRATVPGRTLRPN